MLLFQIIMVRAVYYGPGFTSKLSELCSKGTTTGLVLGSAVDERLFGVFLINTPEEAEDNADDVAANNTNKKTVDVNWMLEHAQQVYKLLPGKYMK